MGNEDTGKEPVTLGELYRGQLRIEMTLREMQLGFVSAQVFSIEKQASDERDALVLSRIHAIEKLREDDRKLIEDQRAKARLMIYGLIGSPLAAAVVVFITTGGLVK